MERGSSVRPLSLLIVPVAAILTASALTLGSQPYLGITLHRDRVVAVVPHGPADRAGLAAGDRLPPAGPGPRALDALIGPLAGIRIGQTQMLGVEHGGRRRSVAVVPEPPPADERRMSTALLAVACGFLFLGGWVWSERRDRLTRPFVALTLVFAIVLAPPPAWGPAAAVAHALVYALATVLLPALCLHVFALFPEPPLHTRGRAALIRAGYGVASLLFAATLVTLAVRARTGDAAGPLESLLETLASLWFLAGLVGAIALFVRSYLAAGSDDARRRLRVVLAGTVLGLAPMMVAIGMRTLSPGTALPGERAAVLATLLVPAAFAWAIAVHRIFEFRLALRALLLTVVVLGAAALAAIVATMAVRLLGHPAGAEPAGFALAILSVGAALATPAHPAGAALGRWLVPEPRAGSALELETPSQTLGAPALLARACERIAERFKLDGCAALAHENGRWAATLADARGATRAAPELGAGAARALATHATAVALDEAGLTPADRDALEAAGAQWLLPVGDGPAALLLLGHRLAGPWLNRDEQAVLAVFARSLAVELENRALKLAARDRGVLERELEQAGALQMRLLPRRAPIYPTLDCAAATLAAESVGGDYYDFVERGDRAFTLVVGDAMGHGVPAALLLAGVQARFRSVARRGEMPGAVLAEINHELVGLEQPEKFIGLLCARVDVRMGRIHLANAGLTPPLVRRRDGGCELVTESGLVLGVSDEARYRDVCVSLAGGDLAVFYTDGLTEARRGDEMFGVERVRELVERHAHRRARDVLAALLGAVREWAEPPLDDLTVMVLKQLADPGASRPDPGVTRLRAWNGAARPALETPALATLKYRSAGADTPR